MEPGLPAMENAENTLAPVEGAEAESKIYRLSFPGLILAVASFALQALSILMLIPFYCHDFYDQRMLVKNFWIGGLSIILGIYLLPSVILSYFIWKRLRDGTHFIGRYRVGAITLSIVCTQFCKLLYLSVHPFVRR